MAPAFDSLITEYAEQLPLSCFVVSGDADLVRTVSSLWPAEQVAWQHFEDSQSALPALFNTPPLMIIFDARTPGLDLRGVVKAIKGDNIYRQVGVLVCLDKSSDLSVMDWVAVEADDFMFFPDKPEVCKLAISLSLARLRRSLDTNPLSHLPGNTSIISYMQRLIDRKADFALGYADLDHFKAFNDKYGFSRGDEVLMFTARAISSAVRARNAPFWFVGHVGGDDFVFVLPIDEAEPACQQMIAAFDAIAPSFYDADDRKRGSIFTTDRQGNPRYFPILSLSIAVVFNRDGCLRHYGEASELASQIKHVAKSDPGSCYRFDRRDCTQNDKDPG